ncbi:MAG TPA: prephenate dehydrogenase/arogenate dehydrogenase family protein [Pirellulales bacterium]|nr:prephenate dehydrogenase/arogenate dehydrogenase family protein [Pirellulales bacterium]
MPRFNTVAILGVGLIGGSIGLGLRRRGLAGRVIGIGHRKESLRVARERGAVDEATVDVAAGVAEADLVIVCTPVGRIVDDVRSAAANCRAGALITDVGSTKAEIACAVAAGLPPGVAFIGSHPLAGSERSGPAAAEADLLVNRVVVVTPDETARVEDLKSLVDFWSSLGARVVRMSAVEHDQALAATSHLPHLVAAALALATPREVLALTASGWADTTRVASGDPELWRQIFASNRAAVLTALVRFDETLAALRAALERQNDDSLRQILAAAKERRDAVA